MAGTAPGDCSVLQNLCFQELLGNEIYILHQSSIYWVTVLYYFSLVFSDKSFFRNIWALKQSI